MKSLNIGSQKKLIEKDSLNKKIDVNIDYVSEIKNLKQTKNAVILCHYYQSPEVQELADYLGDSLYLAQSASKVTHKIIVLAGVHFMAETAKIINPSKKVLIPDLNAGCSLADSCPPKDFKRFIAQYPKSTVVSYINCAAEIKALSDLVCTSSNAIRVIDSIPKNKSIIFAPDRNLGNYLINQTGRKMILWNGSCMVHEAFSLEKIINLAKENPDAKFIAHPEAVSSILEIANFIGSTSGLLKFVQKDSCKKYIVATESGILHEMQKKCPEKTFIPAPIEDETCACSECAYMRLNTLEKIYKCLINESPQVSLDSELISKAKAPIDRMLALS